MLTPARPALQNKAMGLLRLIAVILAFGMLPSCGGDPDEGGAQGSYKGRRGRSDRSGRRDRQRPQPDPPPAEASPPAAAPAAEPAAPPAAAPAAAPARQPQREGFVFPVEASPGSELDIRLNQAKNMVTITSQPAGQSLRVVAGFSGVVSISSQNIVINSPASSRDLVFELGESAIHVNQGDMVTKSQLLAVTSSPVVFSVQKNGAPTVLCVDVVNESENAVSVNYHGQGADSACP